MPSEAAPKRGGGGLSEGGAAGIAVAAVVLVAVVVGAVLYRRAAAADSRAMDLSKQMNSVGGTVVPLELERGCITPIIDTLGKDTFGEVYKATIKHAGVPPYTVAVEARGGRGRVPARGLHERTV